MLWGGGRVLGTAHTGRCAALVTPWARGVALGAEPLAGGSHNHLSGMCAEAEHLFRMRGEAERLLYLECVLKLSRVLERVEGHDAVVVVSRRD